MMMDFLDLLIGPFYFFLILIFALQIRRKLTNKNTKKYFIPALVIKLLGVLLFALVYQFYFKGGDTFTYYYASKVSFWKAFFENPNDFFKLLQLPSRGIYPDVQHYVSGTFAYFTYVGAEEWFLTKIVAIISLFTLNSYLAISLIFGFFCFLGTWKIFQTFLEFYPQEHKLLSWSTLYIPCCLFWASGLLKDTVVFGAMGFLFHYALEFSFFRRKVITSILICIFCYWLMDNLKGYVANAFIPIFAIWIFLKYKEKLKNTFLKAGSFLLTLSLLPIVVYFIFNTVLREFQNQELFKEIREKVEGFQGDHGGLTYSHSGGDPSTYKLDVDVSTIYGMLAAFPQAVNVTLFRPYPFEAKKVAVFLSSIESTFFLFATIYVILFKVGIKKTIFTIYSNPEVFLCLGFSLFLGFIVGLVSFNFGVLTRFKTPLMPFYATFLVMLIVNNRKKVSQRPQKLVFQPYKPVMT